jgi:2-polyprenyl-3-methyl-5-hydroxy-6-metoxy-1,4-benzoquinol methylase
LIFICGIIVKKWVKARLINSFINLPWFTKGVFMEKNWKQWAKRPEVEQTLIDRAKGVLPEMESTKQLVQLIEKVYRPGMKVLDVGCNTGHYLRGLRRINSELDYTGVDAYAVYIDQARTVFANDKFANFDVKDIFEPLFPEHPFDIVYCCNVLLHLPDFRVPVRNLLASTKNVCFIRTLFGEYTTIVRRAMTQLFDNDGEPCDFVYQNTLQQEYFAQFVRELGWDIEWIADDFDSSILAAEFNTLKKGHGTRIVDGKQVDGNIIFNWMWAKLTRPK